MSPAVPGLFPVSTGLGCPHALSQMSNQGCPARREGSALWIVTWPHTPLNTASPPHAGTPPNGPRSPHRCALLAPGGVGRTQGKAGTNTPPSSSQCPRACTSGSPSRVSVCPLVPSNPAGEQQCPVGLGTAPGALLGAWAMAACTQLCCVPTEPASGKHHEATEQHRGQGAMPQMTRASERVGIALTTPQPWAGAGRKTSELGWPSPAKLWAW